MNKVWECYVAGRPVATFSLGSALAADFYVATNGNDTVDGAEAAPFATLSCVFQARMSPVPRH